MDGEIGVCVFADKRQCEEWALLRGDCPPGGIQVSRYATTRERHCAIRGGRMTIPGCAFSPAGLYESARSAASGSSQRTVTLVLNAGRIAMVNITSPSGATQYLAPGHWESAGDAVTVRTDEERLVFEYAGDRLVAREWNRGIWGDGGPGTLLRKH